MTAILTEGYLVNIGFIFQIAKQFNNSTTIKTLHQLLH